jgi:hypothetical protein
MPHAAPTAANKVEVIKNQRSMPIHGAQATPAQVKGGEVREIS